MIDFKPVRLGDRAVIERYTMPSGICNCDLAFANMYCWPSARATSARSSPSCAKTPTPTDSGCGSSA